MLRLPEVIRIDPENASSSVVPGDVAFTWFEAGAFGIVEETFAEICWFYGKDAVPSMPGGPVPVSLFARITEGAEPFFAACKRIRREGVKPLQVTRVDE